MSHSQFLMDENVVGLGVWGRLFKLVYLLAVLY